jgi:hypothetical protein
MEEKESPKWVGWDDEAGNELHMGLWEGEQGEQFQPMIQLLKRNTSESEKWGNEKGWNQLMAEAETFPFPFRYYKVASSCSHQKKSQNQEQVEVPLWEQLGQELELEKERDQEERMPVLYHQS